MQTNLTVFLIFTQLLISLSHAVSSFKRSPIDLKSEDTSHHHSPTKHMVPIKIIRKGKNIPVLQHQYLYHSLHVIPIRDSNFHTFHEVDHVVTDLNINHIPIISSVSHKNLFPIHHNLVPVLHDLTVIPLQHKEVRLRSVEQDQEQVPNFRQVYGGFGQGLNFGGQGAGHGYYAYGKR